MNDHIATKRKTRKSKTKAEPAAQPRLPEPGTPWASLVRKRAALVNEARAAETSLERRNAIYAELNAEPLSSVPTLSPSELERLED